MKERHKLIGKNIEKKNRKAALIVRAYKIASQLLLFTCPFLFSFCSYPVL